MLESSQFLHILAAEAQHLVNVFVSLPTQVVSAFERRQLTPWRRTVLATLPGLGTRACFSQRNSARIHCSEMNLANARPFEVHRNHGR